MSGFGEPMGDENCTYRTLTCCPKADLYTWDVANYLSQDPISWLEVEVVGGTARTRLATMLHDNGRLGPSARVLLDHTLASHARSVYIAGI